MHEIVILNNVSKIYKTNKTEFKALNGINFTISDQLFYSIMGPSGAGKSTLLNMIGLLDYPTIGDVKFLDKSIHNLSDTQLSNLRADYIGFVFQAFNLIPRMSALQNILVPMSFSKKIRKSDRATRAAQLLKEVGLENKANHKPSELSGGEQQRAAVARALANDPFLILADEPTGNLDSKSSEELMNVLKELNKNGRTIVVVTHNTDISDYAGKIITLKDGKIVSG